MTDAMDVGQDYAGVVKDEQDSEVDDAGYHLNDVLIPDIRLVEGPWPEPNTRVAPSAENTFHKNKKRETTEIVTDRRGRKFECHHCGRSDRTRRRFVDHVRSCRVASEAKRYACDACGYRTRVACHLAQHRLTHSAERPHPCDACDYRAAQKGQLTRHRLTQHAAARPYVCDQCPYRSALAANLRLHRMRHSGVRPWACDRCDYSALKRQHLARHALMAHSTDAPFACDLCRYRTPFEAHLKRHLAVHSQVKPYRCKVCGYGTTDAARLRRHETTHLPDKPHSCRVCAYTTTEASNLRRHMTRHDRGPRAKGAAGLKKSKTTVAAEEV